jgi:hypothetical protein
MGLLLGAPLYRREDPGSRSIAAAAAAAGCHHSCSSGSSTAPVSSGAGGNLSPGMPRTVDGSWLGCHCKQSSAERLAPGPSCSGAGPINQKEVGPTSASKEVGPTSALNLLCTCSHLRLLASKQGKKKDLSLDQKWFCGARWVCSLFLSRGAACFSGRLTRDPFFLLSGPPAGQRVFSAQTIQVLVPPTLDYLNSPWHLSPLPPVHCQLLPPATVSHSCTCKHRTAPPSCSVAWLTESFHHPLSPG